MRIAVIGTGISGLVAAHMLHRGHEITVYEAGDYAGGHTDTVRVETETGAEDVDMGFIVFNDRNYPHFELLLEELEVTSQPSHMSFSVADGSGRFEYAGTPLGLFARPAHLVNPAFLGMLRDFFRFNREAKALIGMNGSGPSLGDWLDERGFSRLFVERLIVPQASAVWSANPEQMWSFPASFMAEFFENHGMYSLRDRPKWRTIRGGSKRYVEAITAPWRERLRLKTPVRRIERLPDRVLIAADGCETEAYDEVVIATHSDQALRMLADPSDAEREILGAIPYQRNEAVLHTDTSLMPRRRRAWASWNFHLTPEPAPGSTVTYWMNNLQRLGADRDYLVTLNRSESIDPAKVIRRVAYDHPVYTREGVHAQQRHGEINGRNRTRYCGAYWGWGFHEDGVVSALNACDSVSVTAPSAPIPLEVRGEPAGIAA
jgi:predicted NAD/FAD-binding protein